MMNNYVNVMMQIYIYIYAKKIQYYREKVLQTSSQINYSRLVEWQGNLHKMIIPKEHNHFISKLEQFLRHCKGL